MKKSIEVILDTNPSGGCGCNCGCGGSSVIDDVNDLVEELKTYEFESEVSVDVLAVSEFDTPALINKINVLLGNTNAAFRLNEENIDETLSNILPLVVMDGSILTAYGVPTLYDVIHEIEKNS